MPSLTFKFAPEVAVRAVERDEEEAAASASAETKEFYHLPRVQIHGDYISRFEDVSIENPEGDHA